MTLEGSAIFGAQWKTREAKIIEVPVIPDAMPECTTTYDLEPHTAVAASAGRGSASRWESSAPIRYPDPAIVVLDPRCQSMVLSNAAIERIATGFRFTEGPVYYGEGRYLVFSDINDNTRDREGQLMRCELGSRTLTRTEHDGTVTVLAASFYALYVEVQGNPGG